MNKRLVELEVRVAFQEQTLQELNEVVTRQQQQIDRLAQELATLKVQLTIVAPPWSFLRRRKRHRRITSRRLHASLAQNTGRQKRYDRFSRDFCYNDVISAHPGLHRSLRGNPSRLTSNTINLY